MSYIPYPSWITPQIVPWLPIRWYGLMYLVAFAFTYFLFMHQVKQRKLNISKDLAMNFFFWIIIGLLVGARLFAVTIYDPTHEKLLRPWLIFWPFDDQMRFTGLEGMSFHGGVVGCIVAALIYCRVKKISFLEWGDMIVHGLPLGYTFGRLGNFINGELYGRVSDVPWAVLFPNAKGVDVSKQWVIDFVNKTGFAINDGLPLINLPRHPSQLYEAIFEGLVLWAIMWFLVRPKKPFAGFSLSIYLIGYGFFRFIIEYMREPDSDIGYRILLDPSKNEPETFQTLFNFSTGQVLCFLMIAGGILLLFFFRYRASLKPRAEYFDTSTTETEKDWGAPRIRTPEEIERKKQRRKIRKQIK